jgi:putative transposase
VCSHIITSNHIHLLVSDRGHGEIAKSMQLVTGCTAQAYKRRKGRKGAFWEDRYHATAVVTDTYLAHCMVYVDLNMVRAGVVSHPSAWPWCGHCEIQSPPLRYALIDRNALTELFGVSRFQRYQELHQGWLENKLTSVQLKREPVWTQSLAVGHRDYVEGVRMALGLRGQYRSVVKGGTGYVLKEPGMPYTVHSACEMDVLRAENAVFIE